MRFVHFIAVYSLQNGQRIAWHLTNERKINNDEAKQFLDEFQSLFPDDLLAPYRLGTDSPSWKSVIKKDFFFDDVIPFENKEDFFKEIVDKNGYF